MTLKCFICLKQIIEIDDLCKHLHNAHDLNQSPTLRLTCCANCSDIFFTFSSFKSHLEICIKTTIDSKSSQDTDTNDLNICLNYNSNKIRDRVDKYAQNLYILGLPETTIDKILQMNADLMYPLLDSLIQCPTQEEKINLVHQFKLPFDSKLTKYLRNKAFKEKIVQPIKKSHGIRIDKKIR